MPTTPVSPTTIGKYIGACFLELQSPKLSARSFLSFLSTSSPPPQEIHFNPTYIMGTFVPILVARYQLPDSTVQLQAVRHKLWLRNLRGYLYWSPEPEAVNWHEENGQIRLTQQINGTAHDACISRVYPAMDYFSLAKWERAPHEAPTMKVTKLETSPFFDGYKGPFPSPETMRQSTAPFSLDFNDIFLLGVDLSKSKLPKTRFTKTTLRDVNFGEALLKEAHFQGCVFTRPDDTTICRFNGADAREANFSDSKADRCTFAGAKLGQAKFLRASLTGVDFTGADLSGTDFTGADLTGAIMKDAVLTGTIFTSCNLTRTDFTGCNLRTAKLVGVTMPATILTGADFTGNDLSNADLRTATAATGRLPTMGRSTADRTKFHQAKLNFDLVGLNWSFLDLTGATFVNLPRTTANIVNLTKLNAESAILTDMVLPGVMLQEANLRNAHLRHTNLNGANLDLVHLNAALLQGTLLGRASMMNADLSGADLSHAEMRQVELWGENASLAGATMILTNLTGAYLTAINFSGIKDRALQGCSFDGACLLNANFNNTTISKYGDDKYTSFAEACLQGATFEGASLFGVSMFNAAVAEESGTIQVTTRFASEPLEIDYDRTAISGDITNRITVCPAGDFGPCTIDTFYSPSAPMAAWPPKASLLLSHYHALPEELADAAE